MKFIENRENRSKKHLGRSRSENSTENALNRLSLVKNINKYNKTRRLKLFRSFNNSIFGCSITFESYKFTLDFSRD